MYQSTNNSTPSLIQSSSPISSWIIIVISVVVLLIIGIGGYFWWNSSKKTTPTIVPVVVPAVVPTSTNGYQGCWEADDIPIGYALNSSTDSDLYTGTKTLAELKAIVKVRYPSAKYMAITGQSYSSSTAPIGVYVVIGTTLPTGTKLLDTNPKCTTSQLGYKMGCKGDSGIPACIITTTGIAVPNTWTVYSL